MKKIVMLSLPPAFGVDVMGPLEIFGLASRILEEESGRPGYETEQVTRQVDTLFIAGGAGVRGPVDAALLAWLREMAGQTRRVCSVCTGAFLLANAGLLNGRRATTHWKHVENLARQYPGSASHRRAMSSRYGSKLPEHNSHRRTTPWKRSRAASGGRAGLSAVLRML